MEEINEKGQCLRQMGFYGMERIENSIIAGLVTGEPVLLIGNIGSAKTALASAIARELEMRFWAYDASKALFEDIIGFPSPEALKNGVVDYIPTPLSIWDKEFILVDEISRAAPSMQNKWLEVIRSRQVMGRSIKGLKHIFTAMNPPGYLGVHPLDAALAGRFAFIIPVPEVKDMSEADIDLVISNMTEDDAPLARDEFAKCSGLKKLHTEKDNELSELIWASRILLTNINERYDSQVCKYVRSIAHQFKAREQYLDGRRLGMIRRNILASLAVSEAQCSIASVEDVIFRTLLHSLPFRALSEDLDEEVLKLIHRTAHNSAFLNHNNAFSTLMGMIGALTISDMSELYKFRKNELSEEQHHEVLNRIFDAFENANAEAKVPSFMALQKFVKFIQEDNNNVPADLISRAMEKYADITGMFDMNTSDQMEVMFEREEEFFPVNFCHVAENLAFRLSMNAARDRRNFIDNDHIKKIYPKIVNKIKESFNGESHEDKRL